MSGEDIRSLRSRAASGWLVELSARFPSVVGLKNIEKALAGEGDLDLSAAAPDWDDAVSSATDVVREVTGRAGIVGIECRHVPSVRISLWHPGAGFDLLQLDLSNALVTRGLAWARPDRLVDVSKTDDRGFRVAPAAVQAFVGLITRASGGHNGSATSYALALHRYLVLQGSATVAEEVLPLFDSGAMRRRARDVLEAVAEDRPWEPAFRRFAMLARISALRRPTYAFDRWLFKRRGPCTAAAMIITGRRQCSPQQLREMGGQSGHRIIPS
jgi:hypothetical protein